MRIGKIKMREQTVKMSEINRNISENRTFVILKSLI